MSYKAIAVLALLSLFILQSCGTLDLRNAYALSKMGPMDGDPETGRIAIIWPEGIKSDTLLFMFKLLDGERERESAQFILEIDPSGDANIKTPRVFNIGKTVVYKLPEGDIERAREFQERLDHLKTRSEKRPRQKKPNNKQVLSISFRTNPEFEKGRVDKYCTDAEKAPFYVWYKLDARSDYRRIIKTTSIDKVFGNMIEFICDKHEKTVETDTPE